MKLFANRPADLPDFDDPPLDEVVLGVQFSSLEGYSQIRCGEVWELFKRDYPHVEDRAPLPPTFEIFGGRNNASMGSHLSLIDGPVHDRFWFLDKSGHQLIQFQPDKLLHNWRRMDQVGGYPHFEAMGSAFLSELTRLEEYSNGLKPQKLSINQCEISYINRISISEDSENCLSKWISSWSGSSLEHESVGFSTRKVLTRENGAPYARLFVDCGSHITARGDPAFGLTISVKGAPREPTIDSAMEFLVSGRSVIVNKFKEITTPYAHRKWGIKNV